MPGRLNPKQIRAKKVVEAARKAKKHGKPVRPASDAKVTAAFNRATNP